MKGLLAVKLLIFAGIVLIVHGFPRKLPTWIKKGDNSSSETLALLIATSYTWENYRHQADLCHAYQVLRQHGLPEKNIIVMMYDDIAYNKLNPTPGVIINEPGGPNVYTGIRVDYSGREVTPTNFINVLQGNAEAVAGIGSGRIIQGDSNTNIFVYIVDHGGPGIIGFPNYPIEMLTAEDLNGALLRMHNSRSYKEMVVYVETCHAGSMFEEHLSNNISVYALTGANATESSYACYYSHDLGTFLGDVFSVNWIKDTATENTAKETLQQQYERVKSETKSSHVSQYGQLRISKETLDNYMGPIGTPREHNAKSQTRSPSDAVPSGDVPIAILSHRIFDTEEEWQKAKYEQELIKELMVREKIRKTITDVVKSVTKDESITRLLLTVRKSPTHFTCIRKVAATFSKKCFNLIEHNYAMKLMFSLVNLCESYPQDNIVQAVDSACNY